jgi:hypothetical protein
MKVKILKNIKLNHYIIIYFFITLLLFQDDKSNTQETNDEFKVNMKFDYKTN